MPTSGTYMGEEATLRGIILASTWQRDPPEGFYPCWGSMSLPQASIPWSDRMVSSRSVGEREGQ